MVGVEPRRRIAQLPEALDCVDSSAQVADVNRFLTLLLRDTLPKLPDLEDTIHVDAVIAAVNRIGGVRCLRRYTPKGLAIKLLACFAVADFERAGRGPAVGEEAVDGVALVNLTVDGRHLLGKVGAEHAGPIEPRTFILPSRRAVALTLEPFRMRVERFLVGKVTVHPRHDSEAALLGRRHHVAQ